MLNSSEKGTRQADGDPSPREGPPSLAALGLAGGDGTEPADPSPACRTGSASATTPSAPGAPPLTLLRGPFG